MVIIALPLRAEEKINTIIWQLGTKGISVYLVPDLFAHGLQRANLQQLGDMPIMVFNLFPALSSWRAASSPSCFLPQMITCACWPNRRLAISNPIPRLPPVTTNTLSWRLNDRLTIVTSCCYHLNFDQQTSRPINYGYTLLSIVGRNTCKIQVSNQTVSVNFYLHDSSFPKRETHTTWKLYDLQVIISKSEVIQAIISVLSCGVIVGGNGEDQMKQTAG